MSIEKLLAGRRPFKVVWPDDTCIEQGELGCTGLIITFSGADDQETWVKAEYADGVVMINARHLAMIEFAN